MLRLADVAAGAAAVTSQHPLAVAALRLASSLEPCLALHPCLVLQAVIEDAFKDLFGRTLNFNSMVSPSLGRSCLLWEPHASATLSLRERAGPAPPPSGCARFHRGLPPGTLCSALTAIKATSVPHTGQGGGQAEQMVRRKGCAGPGAPRCALRGWRTSHASRAHACQVLATTPWQLS